jgi:hypothetical protein
MVRGNDGRAGRCGEGGRRAEEAEDRAARWIGWGRPSDRADEKAAHAAASGRLEPAREAERDAHLALLQLGAADWDECLAHIAESGPEIDAFVGAIG